MTAVNTLLSFFVVVVIMVSNVIIIQMMLSGKDWYLLTEDNGTSLRYFGVECVHVCANSFEPPS